MRRSGGIRTVPRMSTTTTTAFDPAKVEALAGRLMSTLTGALVSYMIDLGDRVGLFDAAAAGGTSDEIASRAGVHERYAREWLAAMATAAIVDYDPATATYHLPPEHAVLLTGPGSLAPIAHGNTTLGHHVDAVTQAFRSGAGVPYGAYCPGFTDAMDAMGRGAFDRFLIDTYLPMAPGLVERLVDGARVADFACGTGHALILMAAAYPASTFVGYDLDPHAIERARAEAAQRQLTNVTFELTDIDGVRTDAPLDVAFMFDALHDQAHPDRVLATIRAALADDGTFVLREPHAADTLEGNLMNPMATVQYAVSTLHCLNVSLAAGGPGIGTAFGEQHARGLLRDAGFAEPDMQPAPGQPFDVVYITQPT